MERELGRVFELRRRDDHGGRVEWGAGRGALSVMAFCRMRRGLGHNRRLGEFVANAGLGARRVTEVEVRPEAAPSKKYSMGLSSKTQSYNVGFGWVTVIDPAGVKSVFPTQWDALKNSWNRSRPAGKNYSDVVEINNDFPV